MSKKPQVVSVTILHKEYKIACPPEEQETLIKTAQQLNTKMQRLHDSGKVTGTDRIAVMAALNLAHELEMAKPSAGSSDPIISQHIINLRHKIENALANL